MASSRVSETDREILLTARSKRCRKDRGCECAQPCLARRILLRRASLRGRRHLEGGQVQAERQSAAHETGRSPSNEPCLLEDAYPELIRRHEWNTPKRKLADRLSLWGNANFALHAGGDLRDADAERSYEDCRGEALSEDVEDSLMSGGVIILITAAGGAFGAMLQDTNISDTIRNYFSGSRSVRNRAAVARLGNRCGPQGRSGQQHRRDDRGRGDDVGDHW